VFRHHSSLSGNRGPSRNGRLKSTQKRSGRTNWAGLPTARASRLELTRSYRSRQAASTRFSWPSTLYRHCSANQATSTTARLKPVPVPRAILQNVRWPTPATARPPRVRKGGVGRGGLKRPSGAVASMLRSAWRMTCSGGSGARLGSRSRGATSGSQQKPWADRKEGVGLGAGAGRRRQDLLELLKLTRLRPGLRG